MPSRSGVCGRDGIPYEITPGVPAFAAAAAALGQELTIPEVAQSVVLTRVAMKSSSMPDGETLENFARTGTTLAIHLGVRALLDIERRLAPFYGADCPGGDRLSRRLAGPDAAAHDAGGACAKRRGPHKITRTALILLGPAMGDPGAFRDSALYDPAMPHVLRPRRARS